MRSVLLLIALSPLLPAQMAADKAEAIRLWTVSKEFTLAVADAMPAEHYEFRPDPAEMSFAGLMIHVAASQAVRFAQIAGERMPLQVPTNMPKPDAKRIVHELLAQSFDYCIAKLGSISPEQWNRTYQVEWFERPEVTGRLLVMAMFTHTAHHRGQAEVYMRTKGIKPPAYRF